MEIFDRDYIEQHRDAILATLRDANERAYNCTGCQYSVYIDTDGDTGVEESPAGDNSYFVFHGDYDRFYIHTFCHQYYDPLWDYWFDGLGVGEDAFQERFGYRPVEDDGLRLSDAMEAAAKEHGDMDALVKWLDEERDEAITTLCDEQDYDEILDNRLDQLEME